MSYDSTTNVATLAPQAALQYGATYTATVKGGAGGVTDYVGNALASDVSWSFTTEASPPHLLVVGSSANPFGMYQTEILRDEGLDAFTTLDASLLSSSVLSNFDVVLLGDTALSAGQVTTLTNWVNGGGKLIAMHPDKQLAGLLGLTDAGSTLTQRLPQGGHDERPGRRHHGPDDPVPRQRRPLHPERGERGRDPLLERDHGHGQPGRHAALGRLERRPGGRLHLRPRPLGRLHAPGQPGLGAARSATAWSGIRPDDMFYGAKSGDVQPDWLDTSKIAIPQADEQQRLLVNLITQMERSKLPLPHFWYLPRGEKAVVVLSGDDHAQRRNGEQLRSLQAAQPAGMRRRQLGLRALDLVHLPGQRAHERAGCRLHRRRLRGRHCIRRSAHARRRWSRPTIWLRPSTASWPRSRRSTRACRHR